MGDPNRNADWIPFADRLNRNVVRLFDIRPLLRSPHRRSDSIFLPAGRFCSLSFGTGQGQPKASHVYNDPDFCRFRLLERAARQMLRCRVVRGQDAAWRHARGMRMPSFE